MHWACQTCLEERHDGNTLQDDRGPEGSGGNSRWRAKRVEILVCGERFDAGASLARQLGHSGFPLKDRTGMVGEDAESRRRWPLDAQ